MHLPAPVTGIHDHPQQTGLRPPRAVPQTYQHVRGHNQSWIAAKYDVGIATKLCHNLNTLTVVCSHLVGPAHLDSNGLLG